METNVTRGHCSMCGHVVPAREGRAKFHRTPLTTRCPGTGKPLKAGGFMIGSPRR